MTDPATASQPIWPYIAGGIAAIAAITYSVVRIFKAWRTGIEEEATEKAENTRAIKDNTEATRNLTNRLETISEIQKAQGITQEDQGRRITSLEKARRNTPRRRQT